MTPTAGWRDRTVRFPVYDQLPPSTHVEDLPAEVDRDLERDRYRDEGRR